MAHIELLPEQAAHGYILLIRLAQERSEMRAERPRKVCLPEHIPSMCSADLHVGDASIVVHGEIVLLAGCIAIHRCIVGAVDIRCKNILRKVVVCRADIGIIEYVEHAKKGRRIVAAMIVLIVDQMNVRI